MATVWKAWDELLHREVALKMLREPLSSDPAARRRFRREAEACALLEHPAIAPVYEAGEFEEQAYLVLKLIDGVTIAEFLTQRLPPVAEALRIGRAVASALAYAHRQGVIHRDVTARNIMRCPDGTIYVVDFGLARIKGRTESTSKHWAGTFPYLAPEVLKGREVDARGDLYSLGIVLYELLTGARPFEGDTVEVLQFKCLNASINPPSSLRPELAPEVDDLVLQLLEREPDRRPADAATVARALSILLDGGTAPGGTSDQRESRASFREPVANDPHPGALAERLAAGAALAYLVVLPFEGPDVTLEPDQAALLAGLGDVARAGLARLGRVHVVALGRHPAPGESLTAFCRGAGANLALRGAVRFQGSAVRLSFAVIDPERDVQVGGGTVDGSIHLRFELEDRLVAALRGALENSTAGDAADWRPRPPDPAAEERLAQAVSFMQRFDNEASLDGAAAILEGLVAAGHGSAAVHATLARCYIQKGFVTQQRVWEGRGASACERAARLDEQDPEVQLALGELDVLAGRTAQSLERFDRVLAGRPEWVDALIGKARALDGLGRGEEAETCYARALGARADDWRVHHRLGLSRFRRGRYADAIQPWLRVTEITADNPVAYRNLGSAYFHQDRYEDAERALRRSIAIRPSTMALYNLGTVLFFLERHDECVAAFEKAVDLTPGDPIAWGNLGNACRLIPGREARAAEALDRAVGLMREQLDRADTNGESWARLAGWLAGRGEAAAAEAATRRSLELAPDHVDCLCSAGHVYLLVGRRSDALEFLARAVKGGYGPDALRRDPELRSLHDDPEFLRILAQGANHNEAA